ncbi:SH3-like domain-containing protein [Futiania mangrovi]|uniref:Nitrile hydratase subunit beta n=1 Tax=Futiania mangrovi TaxID=2959716 RepID=A0A9J6PCN9_9PROT|nr:SH3-like domain-containing protein [Futiania mangrovii]MCP1335568.1 nitrile hydratase subunit beta [Futiania mangrovii]
MSDNERKVNDVGGLPGGPIDLHEHANTLHEKRVDALVMLMVNPRIGAFTVDSLRRAIEENTPQEYASLGYYSKWLKAVRQLLVEQAVLTEDEIEAKMADVRKRMEAEAHA